MAATRAFDPHCRRCPRLASHLEEVRRCYPDYHARPVPAFGAPAARLLVVGLAPGLHGANASGRPFTGDQAGALLFETLHRFGFSPAAASRHAGDGLQLSDCRITNAVKCLPPQNKPVAAEINTCNNWLSEELNALPDNFVIIALGSIAHKAVVMGCGLKQSDYKFGHGAEHQLDRGVLIDSYHCSRYNTQTRRLTTPMFEAVFERAKNLLDF